MLEVAELTKEYPSRRGSLCVLNGVSLSLSPGDAVSIMGPSGCGKSTLLYILGALEPPTSGTVTLAGRDLFHRKPDLIPRILNPVLPLVSRANLQTQDLNRMCARR